VKLRILLLVLVGAAGVGASFALADSGKHGLHSDTSTTTTGTTTTGTTTTNPSCQRTHVLGTTSSPQTFTVTVTKSGEHSSLAPGQVVTVTVGAAGQSVRVNAEGCATGSAVAAKQVEVHAVRTASTKTTSTTTTSTTTTNKDHGDKGHRHGHH
jgi:hypothetical protein